MIPEAVNVILEAVNVILEALNEIFEAVAAENTSEPIERDHLEEKNLARELGLALHESGGLNKSVEKKIEPEEAEEIEPEEAKEIAPEEAEEIKPEESEEITFKEWRNILKLNKTLLE